MVLTVKTLIRLRRKHAADLRTCKGKAEDKYFPAAFLQILQQTHPHPRRPWQVLSSVAPSSYGKTGADRPEKVGFPCAQTAYTLRSGEGGGPWEPGEKQSRLSEEEPSDPGRPQGRLTQLGAWEASLTLQHGSELNCSVWALWVPKVLNRKHRSGRFPEGGGTWAGLV